MSDLAPDPAHLLDDVDGPMRLPEGRPVMTSTEAARALSSLACGERLVVTGVRGCGAALVAAQTLRAGAGPLLVVTTDPERASQVAGDIAFLTEQLGGTAAAVTPKVLPTAELGPFADVHPDRRVQMRRASTLYRLAAAAPPVRALVVPAAALLRRVPPPNRIAAAGLVIRKDDEIDLRETAERLVAAGYLRVPLVEDPGSFATRGGLLDVWPPDRATPVRVELLGDMVLTLREFDPEGSRRLDEVDAVTLPPARETIADATARRAAASTIRDLCDAVNMPTTRARALADDIADGRTFTGSEAFAPAFGKLRPLWDYLDTFASVIITNGPAVARALEQEDDAAREAFDARSDMPSFPFEALQDAPATTLAELDRRRCLVASQLAVAGHDQSVLDTLQSVPEAAPTLAFRDHHDLTAAVKQARSTAGKDGALEPLVRRLKHWGDHGLRARITARVPTQADRLRTLLRHRGVADAAEIVVGQLSQGVLAPAENLALLTEEEVFGHRAHRATPRKRKARQALEDLRALTPGDHIVHVDHGIGRYLGLERRPIGDVPVELLVVEYHGGDKLFLPIYRLNQIEKHSSADGAPKLDRLGGTSFAKTKARARKRARQMADELLRLYAERQAAHKAPLPPADDEYAAFEATFPFEETRDQAAAIADVLADQEKQQVMDRLVCGDVGFGKTEVAIRAAFRAATNGRQVALLCPTTVLAQQHFRTISARFEDYPLGIRALSRFQSKAEQTATIKGLKAGTVDVVIGTHRLLSKDVRFKDLGLLIVDEEQRFGVTHKERIKQLRANVDALTLTATPIPRTLQLAISGLRDLSLITTAPVDRRAIRTITSRWDERMLREAVERELNRGGQVFYVYNRVENLAQRAARLQQVVPRARIAIGHGQMSEKELEATMLDFIEGRFDILVATAIVESGLDIPKANTIIIDRADLFGLAQLYQLRGRVGRSHERAYCYLIVPSESELSDDARDRIEALERYSDLGSGFQVATTDMEMRGFGDLLGAEQSGTAATVGVELFCQMLEDATKELRGETITHDVDPELSIDVEALLPEDYLPEVGVRLTLYKRLAAADSDGDVADLATEMEERYGPAPPEARKLVELMSLKTELRRLRVLGLEATARSVVLNLRDDTPLDPTEIAHLVARRGSPYRVAPDGRLTRRARPDEAFDSGLDHAAMVLEELEPCRRADA